MLRLGTGSNDGIGLNAGSGQVANVLERDTSSKLYVCGGASDDQVLKTLECLDFSTGRWEELQSMPFKRHGHAAAFLHGDFYVCGAEGELGHTALRFCPGPGAWKQLPNMSMRREYPAVAALGGRLYVCGGRDK